mmetsp:Transcript_8303/g.11932  ORF Transcript_8303/g.11932 Transcript_8303/m.11932 type:complete len:311 (-) Transcript_8303:1039-1971(-)
MTKEAKPSHVQQLAVSDNSSSWIQLKDKKQFSRLLYTNPVCFLSTIGDTATATATLISSREKATATTKSMTDDGVETPPPRQKQKQQRNVMVLSWLTATNNSGRFMFSINRRRHTASSFFAKLIRSEGGHGGKLPTPCYFILSVPVQGMESLVKDVGQASGKWGSKFPEDYNHDNNNSEEVLSTTKMSKRQKKKHRFDKGVPTLKAIPLFGSANDTKAPAVSGLCNDGNQQQQDLFAIQGTVAHLKCKAYRILEQDIDDDHYLVLAEVEEAAVHPSYWDIEKNLFRPESDATPPYLSFFGSQTFGYVVTR